MDKIARGNRAKELLENELYIESFSHVHDALLSTIERSDTHDVKGRETCYMMLKLLPKLKEYFDIQISEGRAEEEIRKHEHQRQDHLKVVKPFF